MTKHETKEYFIIIGLCLTIVASLYKFTAFIDARADEKYSKTNKVDCRAINAHLSQSHARSINQFYNKSMARSIKSKCNLE